VYGESNPLLLEDGKLAAELVFYFLVIDVLAGDELLSTFAARISDAIENVHDDLALVCLTLAESQVDAGEVGRRKLAIITEGVLKVADRGLTEGDGKVTCIERSDVEKELTDALESLRAGSVLLVVGPPDVGKSHLTMTVVRRLRRNRDVVAFDLRRHRNSVAEFEANLGELLRDAIVPEEGISPPLVVIDGAEAIQTDGPDLFLELVGQSLDSACRVVVVSRSDAATDITDALAGNGIVTSSCEVHGLTEADLTSVVVALPSVRSLVSLSAGAWLARRPGLLQAWLALRPTTAIQNEGHLIDLVRRQSIAFAGPGRQARIAAATALARAELGGDSAAADASAIDQLRNSGVLAERNNSWETSLTFSDDLWRDAALAGLIADDPRALLELSAVRAAIHASLIACQLRLNTDLGAIGSLVDDFDRVATQTGQARWGEVPFEALASLGGTPRDWIQLLENLANSGALSKFLSTAQRTSGSLLSDAPFAMTGLIDVLLDRHADDAEAFAVVRAWLEAAAIHAPNESSPTRRRTCEYLLAHPPSRQYDDDEFTEWLNDIAMCAVDLTPNAMDVLRRTASTRPQRLDAVFRSFRTGYALAESQPELLIGLCELYYVVREGWSMEALRAPYRGLGSARYDAFHTPIARLLQVRPLEALALASRVLDAACEFQPDRMIWGDEREATQDPGHIRVDLPGRGPTELRGGDAWIWYRGGLTSPASAVSILLAIERFADQIVRTGGTVDWVTELLLRHAQSTPLVGLCVGLSIRHLDIDAPSDAFLCWVAQRTIWDFEITRLTHEHASFGLMRTNEVANEDRRRQPIGYVVSQVAASAVLRGDTDLMPRLEAAASALEASGDADPFVRMGACGFRPSLMRVESDGDRRAVFIDPPADLVDAVVKVEAEVEAANEPDNTAMRYMYRAELKTPLERLADDVSLCRSERASGSAWSVARVNTAAAALRAALSDEVDLSDDDLCWATNEVLGYLPSIEDEGDNSLTWLPVQALASVVPVIHSTLNEEPTRIASGGIRARLDETSLRLAQVGGAEVLWTMLGVHASHWRSACTVDDRAQCLNLITERLTTVIMKRSVRELRRPSRPHQADEGAGEPSRYVQPDLLLAPLVLASSGVQLCSHVQFDVFLDEALELHAEPFGTVGHSPHTDGNHFARIGRVLFALANDGHIDRVATYIHRLTPSYQARALRGMRQVAGDNPDMRPGLERLWPDVMSQLDGTLTHDDRWSDVQAELVPSVAVNPYSVSQSDAWNEAIANWIDPRSVEAQLVPWTQRASGCGNCAGALGSFMLSSDPAWLRETGLPLMSELIRTVTTDGLKDRPAAWLADIPNDTRLAGELVGNEHLLSVIDRYVQADDYYAQIARERMDPGRTSI
jgi:hypothetical protein